MDDREKGEILFSLWTSYAATCLFVIVATIAAWLAFGVRKLLDWLGARLKKQARRHEAINASVSTGATVTAQVIRGSAGPSPLGGPFGLPTPRPEFVNSASSMRQWEVLQREQELAGRAAMASTMKGFPAALLWPPPSNAHVGSPCITQPTGAVYFNG